MDTYEIWNSFKTHIYPFVAYQKATQLVFETKTFCNMVEFSFLLLEVVYFYNANTLLALLSFIICGWKKLEIKKHYPLIALCYKWRKFYIFVSAVKKYSNFIDIRFFLFGSEGYFRAGKVFFFKNKISTDLLMKFLVPTLTTSISLL